MRPILLLLISLTLLAVPGCCATAPMSLADDSAQPVTSSETATVLEGLATRAELLKQLHGWGVIELQWSDENGEHFEQGDLEFWMEGSDRWAVLISKLGDPYFWIGTDGTQAWVFDLSERPHRLLSDSMDKVRAASQEDDQWLSILDTIQMMRAGLGMLRPADGQASEVSRGNEGTWWLSIRAGAHDDRQLRMQLDPDTWRPLQVELLQPDGTRAISLQSRTSRTKRVDIPGRSSLGSPIVSAVMEVRDAGPGGTLARFAFEGLRTDLSTEPVQTIFNLDTMRSGLRPKLEGPLVPTRLDDAETTTP